MSVAGLLRKISDFNNWNASEAKWEDLNRSIDDYGYSSEDDFPLWFRQMLKGVAEREPSFLQYAVNDSTDSDMGSILIELQRGVGWDVDDFGEGVLLVFPASRVRVEISRLSRLADGSACNSCTVMLI